MRLIRGLQELHLSRRSSVVTIGVFDGLHIGHAKVISLAVARAKRLGIKSVVITFDPHPAKTLHSPSGVPSLISLEHRIRLIEEFSPDYLVVLNFTKPLAALPPAIFVKRILLSHAGAREVFVGDNFYFGKGAAAGPEDLRRYGSLLGFKVNVVDAVRVAGKRVSSSVIRRLVSAGEIAQASKYLGRPVAVLGTVVGGANLARELGYPTANINPHHEVIPPRGVYAVKVRYGHRLYNGVLNIGWRPTFYAPRDREPTIEVHIFGFRRKIYGKDLEALFVRKIRDERRYHSREALIAQIARDEKSALAATAN